MRSQALGHDAVALVEHAGLNPMGSYSGAAAGRELKAPRAGCPKGNLRATLRALTDAGLSVVVLEEAQPEGFAAVRSRTLSAVVLSDTDPLADEAKIELLRQITRGLHYLHTNRDLAAHGLTHRDLKPDNVLVKRLVNGDNVAKLAGGCVEGIARASFHVC